MGALSKACRSDDSLAIYRALRDGMADKLEDTESGRDYAAIAKSFICVQEKVDELSAARKPKARNAAADAMLRHSMAGLKVVNG